MAELIRVSKQGVDVLGSAGTVPNNLIFDSNLNTFKIVASGTTTGTIPSGSLGTIHVAHGLSFTPPVTAFVKRRGFTNALTVGAFRFFPQDDYKFFSASADPGSVNFEINNTSSNAGTFDISYFCFEIPL